MSFVVLYIYKWVSSPTGIKSTKNQIKANILAIRLYKDLWKVIVSSFFKSLYYTFKYFILNFGPVLLIIPILFPAFAQMDARYGLKPFQIEDEIILKAKFAHDIKGMTIELQENPHFKLKMNPVFIKSLKEVNWKLEVAKEGITEIQVKVGDRIFEKKLVLGKFRGALSNKMLNKSSWSHFLYPVDPLLPQDGEVVELSVHYPGKDISFLGIEMNWLIWNLILVVLVVLAFKNRFGIEF
jgi:hypothetical protein